MLDNDVNPITSVQVLVRIRDSVSDEVLHFSMIDVLLGANDSIE